MWYLSDVHASFLTGNVRQVGTTQSTGQYSQARFGRNQTAENSRTRQPVRFHDPLLRSGSETQRRFHELEIAGGVACVAAYRQAVRSDALRLQRTVEDRHHGIYERELHVRVHDGRNGALHRTQPCHVQAGFQENQRPDTRKMAYPKTARSGLCQNERGR